MIERPESSYPVKLNLPGDDQAFELFACSCGAERTAVWEGLLAEVTEELTTQYRGSFLTAVVYGLTRYSATITGIPADQWAAIETATWDGAFRTRIQCDQIEHGLAATWRAYTERFPSGSYVPPDEDGDEDGDE